MIVIVISCVEGIQQQTIEVIKLAQHYHIPVIVALNKIDRAESDPESLIIALADHGIELDEIGGDVPSARISGLTGFGLDNLEQKIIEVS